MLPARSAGHRAGLAACRLQEMPDAERPPEVNILDSGHANTRNGVFTAESVARLMAKPDHLLAAWWEVQADSDIAALDAELERLGLEFVKSPVAFKYMVRRRAVSDPDSDAM
jgi:hypothetical protein